MKHLQQLHDRGATLQRDVVTAFLFSSFFLFVSKSITIGTFKIKNNGNSESFDHGKRYL